MKALVKAPFIKVLYKLERFAYEKLNSMQKHVFSRSKALKNLMLKTKLFKKFEILN